MMTCKSMNLTQQINDIEWSPFTSTIFGCVVDDGYVEIWDLAKQSIDPILRQTSIIKNTNKPTKINKEKDTKDHKKSVNKDENKDLNGNDKEVEMNIPDEIPDLTPKKSIKFSRSSQVVAIGNNESKIDLFRLYNLEHVQVY